MSSVPSLEDVLERGRRDRSLDECLAGLAEVLNTELPVHRLVAGLIHPDRERLMLVGVWTSGPTQVRLGAVVRLEATAFPQMVEGAGPVLMEGTPERGLRLLERVLWTERIRSVMSVPLREEEAPSGILIVGSQVPDAFTEDHLLLFSTLGFVCQDILLELGRLRLEDLLRTESPDG